MKIYIRHAEKVYGNKNNQDQYQYDSVITNNGVRSAYTLFNCLLESYGIPDLIIVSPFKRTRQTSDIALDLILNYTRDCKVVVDNQIGAYVGNHLSINENCLYSDTLEFTPIVGETYMDYKLRIYKHFKSSLEDNRYIWYITHGSFIKEIGYLYNINMSSYPKPLYTLKISDPIINKLKLEQTEQAETV